MLVLIEEKKADPMKISMCMLFVCSMASCDAPTATNNQSIIGGTTDTGDPCVVGVFVHAPGSSSGTICTGTTIGSHTVLTAARCVSPATIGAGQIIDLLRGTTLALPGIPTTSRTFNPAWNPNNPIGCHDEGILHTAQTLSPSCNRGTFNPNLNVRIVGYGSNTHANGGVGTKRTATVAIDAFNSVVFQDGNSNMQTCHGDTGGPAFQGTLVVGVATFGQDQSPTSVCFNGGFHCRVDADAAFINANTNNTVTSSTNITGIVNGAPLEGSIIATIDTDGSGSSTCQFTKLPIGYLPSTLSTHC